MNKTRREELNKLTDQIAEIRDAVQALADEEQEYFDNMPESLQTGEKGEAAEAAISELNEAIGALENAEANLNSAVA